MIIYLNHFRYLIYIILYKSCILLLKVHLILMVDAFVILNKKICYCNKLKKYVVHLIYKLDLNYTYCHIYYMSCWCLQHTNQSNSDLIIYMYLFYFKMHLSIFVIPFLCIHHTYQSIRYYNLHILNFKLYCIIN